MMELQSILSRLQISEFTPMQQAAMKVYDTVDNLIILSPTGSGKTLAFLLPMVQSLQAGIHGVQAVILVPSRELALQTENVFKSLCTPFTAISCYGGRPAMQEHRAMTRTEPDVIIATPGRLNDHLHKHNFEVQNVRTLVIDEFDKCLEWGFQEEMAEVVGQLPALQKRVLLSATDAKEIPLFVGMDGKDGRGKGKDRVVKLDYLSDRSVADRLCLQRVLSPEKDKLETLYRLLCTLGETSTLVFVNYRESVERVAGYLEYKHFPCGTFHGGMEQPARERALYRFRNGSCPVLISTDLAARGLDIPHIDNIVHYHLPVNEEAFVHRNGRTARWQAIGTSYLILHAGEQLPDYVMPEEAPWLELPGQVPAPPKPRWTTLYIGKGKKDKINKVDIAGFLYKKGRLNQEDIGLVDVKEHYAFVAVRRDKAKQLLSLVRGEKIKGVKALVEEAK